eukprot:UN33656
MIDQFSAECKLVIDTNKGNYRMLKRTSGDTTPEMVIDCLKETEIGWSTFERDFCNLMQKTKSGIDDTTRMNILSFPRFQMEGGKVKQLKPLSMNDVSQVCQTL